MSGTDTDELPALSDVFRKAMLSGGNNLPVAFIAVLDELDRRQALIEGDIEQNGQVFTLMAERFNAFSTAQEKLPDQVRSATQNALRAALPDLNREARDGACSGAAPAKGAIEALRAASEDYEGRKAWVIRLAFIGLPVVFLTTIFIGLMLGSFGIRHLPPSWQWSCKLVGAQHWQQSDGSAFCVIPKQ